MFTIHSLKIKVTINDIGEQYDKMVDMLLVLMRENADSYQFDMQKVGTSIIIEGKPDQLVNVDFSGPDIMCQVTGAFYGWTVIGKCEWRHDQMKPGDPTTWQAQGGKFLSVEVQSPGVMQEALRTARRLIDTDSPMERCMGLDYLHGLAIQETKTGMPELFYRHLYSLLNMVELTDLHGCWGYGDNLVARGLAHNQLKLLETRMYHYR
jgi:hypothetical protein